MFLEKWVEQRLASWKPFGQPQGLRFKTKFYAALLTSPTYLPATKIAEMLGVGACGRIK